MFHSQPVPEELQNGESFGYIIAFRAFGEVSWTHVATSAPGASRYVYRNESIAPFSPFHVKVGTYNSKGQGPFSPVVTIYSAEIGKGMNVSGIFLQSYKALTVDEMDKDHMKVVFEGEAFIFLPEKKKRHAGQ